MQEVYQEESHSAQNISADDFAAAESSHEHKQENVEGAPSVTAAQDVSDDSAFAFTISDPVKAQGNSSLPYWAYKVTAKTNLANYQNKNLEVLRRYSDFSWLHDKLASMYPGCIVPPVPEKSMLGALEKVFASAVDSKQLVQYRQRALLKFVTRTGEHPVLQKSTALQQFLESNDQTFEQIKKAKLEPPKTAGWFSKALTKEPEWIQGMKKFLTNLEEGLKWMKMKLQEMVQRRKSMSVALADFAKGFRYMGLCEKQYQENVMSRSLLEVSQKAEQVGGLIINQADRETIHLVETFSYYLGICEEIKRVVKNLENMRLIRDSITANLKSYQANLEKLQKTPQVKEDKLKQAEQQVTETSQQEMKASEELKTAEDMFKADCERFDLERKVDFAYMLRSFVLLQIEHADAVKNHWESLLPSINLITSGADEEAFQSNITSNVPQEALPNLNAPSTLPQLQPSQQQGDVPSAAELDN